MNGPIERAQWPERLSAHVVDRANGRIHGYGVGDDLAVNFSFAENVLLALTGAAPTPAHGRAFEVAMTFASVVSAGEAQVHAASVAQMCATESKNVVGISALLGSARADRLVETFLPFLEWLSAPVGPIPDVALDPQDRGTRQLVAALPAPLSGDALFAEPLSLGAAVVAVFHRCGLIRREHVVVALTVASLATAAAEALATSRLGFRDYPMTTPPFAYEEPEQ